MSVRTVYALVLSRVVLSRLVLSSLVLSCFCVTLVACFVFLCCVVSCVWRGLSLCFSVCPHSVTFVWKTISLERERKGMCLFSVFVCVCCVLFYNPCACTLFVFGSGWSTVARLKLEGIDGKSPSGAEPAACEPAACERPVVVCVGGEGGGEGERVSASIASPCVRSKRPRVYRHQAHIFHTCGLGAGTHADVLNVHTEAF